MKRNVNKKETQSGLVKASKKNYFCPLPADTSNLKIVNLAIQGGGAHGAFAWGVIDRILADDRIHIEGISGTSAGSMNAVVLAYGMLTGGKEEARKKLHDFWQEVAVKGKIYNPCQQLPWEKFWYSPKNMDQSLGWLMFELITRWFSPYQLNPMDINPLKDILNNHVNFEELKQCQITKLFLTATNVRTGQVKVFKTDEVSADSVMASACLPYIYKAVEIDGEYYWDGGYSGNPSLFPLFYGTKTNDIVIIHINPIERAAPPILSAEIYNRINEISFNSALLKEFRAIEFVHKLLDEDMLKEEYKKEFKYILLHSINADKSLNDLSASSKMSCDWNFIYMLYNRGRAKADEWLAKNFDSLGDYSSINLREELVGRKR
jgi:NTE family protein